MRLSRLMALPFLVSFTLIGCASTAPVRYGMNFQPLRPAPIPYHMVIDPFTDVRPDAERTQPKCSLGNDCSTSDRDFKPGVSTQIAEVLAKHLVKAGLIKSAVIREVDDSVDQDPGAMRVLAQEGVDIVMTAQLAHFTGFQSGTNPAGMMFGALGVLTEAIANKKSVKGQVEYRDLRIIDIKQQRVLWTGNIGHQFERQEVFYNGHVAYALEALKDANGKVAIKLNELL